MHKYLLFFLIVFITYGFSPYIYVYADNTKTFNKVVPGREFSFPRDHGEHPEFETEWWYYTGHLETNNNEMFGFQLTFFRVSLNKETSSNSKWHTNSIHLAHFALTDEVNKKFYHFEKTNRESFGLAGSSPDALNIWNGSKKNDANKWQSFMEGEKIFIDVKEDEIHLKLQVKPKKPLILQGDNGFSKKGADEGEASYYYSYTRLVGDGTLNLNDKDYKIKNASLWMDREFTSSKLAQATEGWDWFAIQLNDNTEIMVYQLRDKKNNPNEFSSGTFVDTNGNKINLNHNDFKIEVLSYWKSKNTNIKYPSEWNIKIPKLNKSLNIKPVLPEQELTTERTTNVSYWEGRAKVYDNSKPSEKENNQLGNAYVELVGYK